MAQLINSGQLDPMQAVQTLAGKIKAANPDIDPQTLEMATEQAVNMVHGFGLDPALKAQIQFALAQYKETTVPAAVTATNASHEKIATGHDVTSAGNAAGHDAASEFNTGTRESGENDRLRTRLADADNHFNQTFQRLTASDRWKQMSASQKQLYEQQKGKLQQRLVAAKAKVAAATADPANIDKAALALATKEIGDIDSALNRISTVGTGQPSGGGAQPQDRGAQVDLIHPGAGQQGARFNYSGRNPPAPAAISDRKVGTVYQTPKGPMAWTAQGWVPAQ